jgi:hypothetical protein
MRTELELALCSACDELSGPSLRLAWRPSRRAIEAVRPGDLGAAEQVLACCEIERTDGGLVARQQRQDAYGRRLEHGYSQVFSADKLWRRWTDGAELTDEDLGAELVSWTFRLAMDLAGPSPTP